jgi:hypothetical protein
MAEQNQNPVATLDPKDVIKGWLAKSWAWIQERLMAKDPISRETELVDPPTEAALLAYERLLKDGKVKLLSPAESDSRSKSLLEKIDRLKSNARATRKGPPAPK